MTSSYRLSDILLLGDQRLRAKCSNVEKEDVLNLEGPISGMYNLIKQFRVQHGLGRGIAAPQIGLLKRIVCLNIDTPMVLFNPIITQASSDMFELWDDCMSFPNLFVKLKRHKAITVEYFDQEWNKVTWEIKDDLSELLQHEIDHLDGILAIDRSIEPLYFGSKPKMD